MGKNQYTSIIRLLLHIGLDPNSSLNLQRLRKQLMIEFNMSSTGFISIDDFIYTRQSVFEELEKPDFEERLIFHRLIWQLPVILNCLEKNRFNLAGMANSFRPLVNRKGFCVFFSPYFVDPFCYASRSLQNDGKFEELGILLSFSQYLTPENTEEAYRPIRTYLDETMHNLKNISKDNYLIMRPKIQSWVENNWYSFLNNLPSEFFSIKCDLAGLMINLCVKIQRNNKKDCCRISEQLMLLTDLPSNIRDIIVKNDLVFSRYKYLLNQKSTNIESKDKPSIGSKIYKIIILFFILSKIAGCLLK